MSEETVVVFRTWNKGFGGGVIALFPYETGSSFAMCCSYEHAGQHGDASPWTVIDHSKPASEAEYAALKRELESEPFRYKLKVRKRMPPDAAQVRERKWRGWDER